MRYNMYVSYMRLGDMTMEKLIQIRIEEEIRNAADEVFRRNGLTTQQAVKCF